MHISPFCQHIIPLGKCWSRTPVLTRDGDLAKIRQKPFLCLFLLVGKKKQGGVESPLED